MNMKELIKEAERLYKYIDKTQVDLISSRLVGNEEKKQAAINHMETLMCSTLQFLKCIIERKNNIVDLSEIWKDGAKEKPLPYSDIVIRDCCITSSNEDCVDESQWAYLEDLLPKGGEE